MTANPLPPIPPISATTGMAPLPGSSRFKPIDPLKVVRQHLHWLVLAGVVGLVLGVAAYFALNQLAPKWTSYAQLKVNPPVRAMDISSGNTMQGNSEAIERAIQNEVIRLRSEEILRQAVDTPQVRDTEWFKQFTTPKHAQESLQKDYLSVSPVRGSTLITLSVSTKSESDAPRILDAITSVFFRIQEEEFTRDGAGAVSSLVAEQSRTSQELNQVRDQLRLFTQQNDLTSLDARASEANLVYQQLTTEQTRLSFLLTQMKESLAGLEQKVAAGDNSSSADTLAQVEALPEVLQIAYRLNNLREQVQASRNRFGENHLNTRGLESQLDAAEAEKRQVVERKLREQQLAQLESTRTAIATLEGQIAAIQPRLQESAARLTDLNTKLTEYQQLQERSANLQDKLQQLDMKIAEWRILNQRADARPVQMQAAPTIPLKTFPKLLVVVPGVTLLCLGLTGGVIFLRELLDQRVKTPADVKLLPDTDLLGVLPDAVEDPSAPTGVERVVEKYPTGLMAESFRQVRTAVLGKMDRRGYKTLMIVGGQPGSGASTVTQNLAASLAFNGREVLIVDANFRRPSQHRLVGISNDQGLIDVLQGRARVEDVIVPLEGVSISVLPTGKGADAPPELLECAACRTMLSAVESRYDVVLIDAPPALLASEAQLLAKHVDATAVVIRAGNDHRGMVERLLRRLDGHRADVLGVILNGVRSAAGGYFRKNYRDFYRYREDAPQLAGAERGRRRLPAPASSNGNGKNGHA